MADPARGTAKELCELGRSRRTQKIFRGLASRIDRELDPIIRASWEDQEPAVEAEVHRIQWAIHELEKGDLGVGLAA
jgi:hypothetical protein